MTSRTTLALWARRFARALLVAIAVVILIPAALVVVGGFVPTLPTVGRLSTLLNEDLAWILLATLTAVALSAIAWVIGGRRGAPVLFLACVICTAGEVVVTYRYVRFAADNGASFSVLRQLESTSTARQPTERVTYATVDGLDLHTAIWRAPSDAPHASGSGRPAVVYIHGGAFVTGMIEWRPTLFTVLADRGFTVVDIEYRLAPPPRWADAPGDVLCALAWVRRSVADLGIDPTQVFVMGESAGGSLALVTGYAAGTNAIRASCEGEPIVPAGVIAVAPAADLEGIWSDRTAGAAGLVFPEAYIGGTPSEYPERYEAASPYRLLRPGLPPSFIIGADNDHIVLPKRVTMLAQRISAAGVDCRLLMISFAEHGFDGAPNGFAAQLEELIIPAFLTEHLVHA